MTPPACKTAEPIPGYTVRDRIGTGGYGEVWRADAPGGLTKAIKFVYGYLSDQRAANELKSLSRVKEVRHPFLLSLERIEVIDGHLVIVTELADGSLKDRFEACKAAGKTGIPREELLTLLGDAADALDYMREQHSLQHLDVKPENLLVLGGHVKVADFGLVKDIYATGASLMGGMTPVYASPEVFDGRPSRHSDQYSLAIVYQEMLTGIPPFSGRTAAQLAKQHTSSAPRLTPLPAAEQPLIATALAKNPAERFPSCSALIDSLRRADPARRAGAPNHGATTPVDPETAADTTSVASNETEQTCRDGTGPAGRGGLRQGTDNDNTVPRDEVGPVVRKSDTRRRPAPAVRNSGARPAIQDLPPIEVAAENTSIPPTVILGIGGTAARTLCHLRRRLHDRFGTPVDVPALQMVLLDTDRRTLVEVSRGEEGAMLTDRETLATPLRRPQEYRQDSPALLSWLSRRWLYNIPRSLQTEGLRPLGRLALVDHAQEVVARIRQALADATAPAAIERSATNTGAAFRDAPPRVLIVASIAGGTGSGMVLDVAYAVRKVLADMGLPDRGVCGLLAHSTSRQNQVRDLAVTNTYACLSELYTYTHPEGFYPGNPACQLEPIEGATPTFEDVYFIHLGDDLNDTQFDAATDRLAEYVYLDTVTSGRAFFQQCRELAPCKHNAPDQDVTVRTFGIHRLGQGHGPAVMHAANLLCQQVIRRWRGAQDPSREASGNEQLPRALLTPRPDAGAPSASEEKAHELASQYAAELALDFDQVAKQLYEVVHQHMDGDQDAFFRLVLEELCQQPARRSDPAVPLLTRAVQTIDLIAGHTNSNDSDQVPLETAATTSLHSLLEGFVDKETQVKHAALTDWILQQTDRGAVRVGGAEHAGNWLEHHLRAMEDRARKQLEELDAQLAAIARAIAATPVPEDTVPQRVVRFRQNGQPKTNAAQLLVQYADARVHAVVLRGICKLAQALQGAVARTVKQLRDMRRELDRIGEAFDMLASRSTPHDRESKPRGDGQHESVAESLQRRMPELVARLDANLQQEFIGPCGGFAAVLTGNVDHRAQLPAALRSAARSVVRPALREIDVAQLVLPAANGSDPMSTQLEAWLEAATPRLLQCGGRRRFMVVLPAGSPGTQLAEQVAAQVGTTPSLVVDPDVDAAIFCEAENLLLTDVATSLVEGRPDLVEVAARLHTRVDANWSKLEDVGAER